MIKLIWFLEGLAWNARWRERKEEKKKSLEPSWYSSEHNDLIWFFTFKGNSIILLCSQNVKRLKILVFPLVLFLKIIELFYYNDLPLSSVRKVPLGIESPLLFHELADSDTYVVQRYKSLTFFLSFHTNAFESNYKKYICSWACYLGFPNRVKGVQKLLFSFPLHSPLLVQHDVQRNWKGGNIKTIFSKNLIYFFI